MSPQVHNYSLRTTDIEVIEFDSSSQQALQDLADWVLANLPSNEDVIVDTSMSMGGYLRWSLDGGVNWITIDSSWRIVKDSNGTLRRMSPDLIDALYNPAP